MTPADEDWDVLQNIKPNLGVANKIDFTDRRNSLFQKFDPLSGGDSPANSHKLGKRVELPLNNEDEEIPTKDEVAEASEETNNNLL